MDSKLTLKLDQSVIAKAKIYAKAKKISVSKLIENYLHHITERPSDKKEEITPTVKSLSGIIKLPKNTIPKRNMLIFLPENINNGKSFVDTDIILDLLAGREPYYQYAAKLFRWQILAR